MHSLNDTGRSGDVMLDSTPIIRVRNTIQELEAEHLTETTMESEDHRISLSLLGFEHISVCLQIVPQRISTLLKPRKHENNFHNK